MTICQSIIQFTLQWRHNERDGVLNHRRLNCLLNRLFRRRSKETSKLRITGLCEGNSSVIGEFPIQRASNAEVVSIWWRLHVFLLYPLYTGAATLCLPCATTKLARSPLKAEGRPNGCLGRSRVAHRTFRHRHGRHGRREVLFKTVAQRLPRRSVAHRSLKGGRMKAHTSLWSQNGCTVVGHWSPSKKCEHCVSIWATRLPPLYHHCASFGRPMASIERSQWRLLCLHSATTATLEPPWQWFCLHSAFFARPVVPLQQFWSFKEGTRVVLQQLHRNITFWVPATTERPKHFMVAQKWHEGRKPV